MLLGPIGPPRPPRERLQKARAWAVCLSVWGDEPMGDDHRQWRLQDSAPVHIEETGGLFAGQFLSFFSRCSFLGFTAAALLALAGSIRFRQRRRGQNLQRGNKKQEGSLRGSDVGAISVGHPPLPCLGHSLLDGLGERVGLTINNINLMVS